MNVSIELTDYWYESISQAEALERLKKRSASAKRLERLQKELPPEIHHYITFRRGAFREYAAVGDEAFLVLLLPASSKDNFIRVYGPAIGPSAKSGHFEGYMYGIDIHEYSIVENTLFEDGVPRQNFRHSNEAVTLLVDVSHVASFPKKVFTYSLCCDLCEIVHSALNIHQVDNWCCLGRCFPKGDFPEPHGPTPA